MLFYPKDLEVKLEIDQVRDFIKRHCASDLAKDRLDKASPLFDENKLTIVLEQTKEMMSALTTAVSIPTRSFHDIFPFLKRVKTKGTFLEANDFSILKSTLISLYEWTQFFKKNGEDFKQLLKLTHGFVADKLLADEIDQKIDERGEVRDTASKELSVIRTKILKAERQVRKVIHTILEKSKKDEFTEEDSSVTIRDGRLVIPVKSEFKRKLPGFVHDESSTGQTVFMEPTEVLDLNNEVRELQYAEKREIIRILTELSDNIRAILPDIQKGAEFMIKMDVIHAKALFAREFEAIVPKLSSGQMVKIENGRHPILWKRYTEHQKQVEPLNVLLDANQRMLVISGPNAGGKSVALKTLGILQYMVQCGFPVTVDETSEFSLFRNFFVDIGDSQSLENDLSTYSSHLNAMRYFTEFADKKTLILIDEFGTGTEPQFGGAIAESILDSLNSSRSYGIVTTHYSNLKEFAERTSGLVNGAMRYDTDKLMPLFQLEIGKPGSSFAFEIAEKIGIRKQILKSARKLVGYTQVNYDKLLGKLDSEKAKFEKENKSLAKQKDELSTIRSDYESLKAMVEKDKKIVLKEAKEEALRILSDANKKVERTIREIKEAEADKERTRNARQGLSSHIEKIQGSIKKHKVKPVPPAIKVVHAQIKEGDRVRLKEQGTLGEISKINGKKAEVVFGNLKSMIQLSKLEKVDVSQVSYNKRKVNVSLGGLRLDQKRISFSHEIDVRGKRAEEILPIVDKFIDDALVLGVKELRVLHGKGHGILKDIIRNHLKKDPNISNMADEHVEHGGSGITIVNLQ